MMETYELEHLLQRIRNELLGRYFSNRSELRHMAEGAGYTFVPVEFVSRTDTEALAILRPKDLGEVHVRASRPVAWQPYQIMTVTPA